jgi:purine-nucleoside phosphorylase
LIVLVPQNKIEKAVRFLRRRAAFETKVDTGIILGTGFADLVGEFDIDLSIPYTDMPGFPVTTVQGHPGIMYFARHESEKVGIMQGRVHLYEGAGMDDILMPISTLRALGCRDLIITNAAGGLDPQMSPGDLMIISDHINMTGLNPLAGGNSVTAARRFMDATNLYDAEIREKARAIADKKKIPIREGVYLGVTGPSYETPAEVRAFRTLGADAVGMSTVIEALYARYLDMRVFGLSCISNIPAHAQGGLLQHASVQDVVSKSLPRASKILLSLMGHT